MRPSGKPESIGATHEGQAASDAADTADERLPVTVVTGFLGSGKTTLINGLLKHPDMAETAVLVNEFGEIGLDHLLVEAIDETTVLIGAGCLCCTVREDMVAALGDLLAWREAGTVPAFRRVLLETTGLADPRPHPPHPARRERHRRALPHRRHRHHGRCPAWRCRPRPP